MSLSLKSALIDYATRKEFASDGSDSEKIRESIPNLRLGGGALTWSKDYLLYNGKSGSWKVIELNIFERFFRWLFCCLWSSTKLTNIVKPLYNDTSLAAEDRKGLCDRIDRLMLATYPHRETDEWRPKIPHPWSPALEVKEDADGDVPTKKIKIFVVKERAPTNKIQTYDFEVPSTHTLDQLKDTLIKAIAEENEKIRNKQSDGVRRHIISSAHEIIFATSKNKKESQIKTDPAETAVSLFEDKLYVFVSS